MEPKQLDPDRAAELLPDKEIIHVFRNMPEGILLGSEWLKREVIEQFRKVGVERSGELATKANHGLCTKDDNGNFLFIETRLERSKEVAP